ncbi:MAG: D-glycero-beta-D-manno-heptose 1,7-bisphosphate 7-phosphatase [Gammaproteobacteria bacterium]|nr:D-glycero-beta-D-manno-heptose 1,7-bisphosphate 7-phosphatase [Gammaproteobacteria bacterium]
MARRLAEKGLVVLDRDGVINEDSASFVKSADEWRPLHGSIAAIAALHRAGFTVAVASNQSGLARGLFDRKALSTMHRKFRRLVDAAGGRVDRIVVCPHGPDDDCNCRKPRAGLLKKLARYYDTTLASVPVVGDSERDLAAARAVGARPILVRTGNGRRTEAALAAASTSVEVFDDLAAAAAALIAEDGQC